MHKQQKEFRVTRFKGKVPKKHFVNYCNETVIETRLPTYVVCFAKGNKQQENFIPRQKNQVSQKHQRINRVKK